MSTRVISRSAATYRLLEIVREHVGMDVAWVSRFDGGQQAFEHVSAAAGAGGPAEGSLSPLSESYCVRVLDGRLPTVVPDSSADERTRDLSSTTDLDIGSYVGVPIPDPDGSVRGMLCCTSREASPELASRDLRVVQMLAQVIGELNAPDESGAAAAALSDSVRALVRGEGRRHVLQPIVDLRTGQAVGYEALARFDVEPFRPDLWFEQADSVRLRAELEVAAAATALTELSRDRDGYVSVNLSPDLLRDGLLDVLLRDLDPARIVVEVTEHAQISDYAPLAQALAPYRARGLRLAIDDAGAGYASFRHILELRPEIIKADISLVRGIDDDPVRQALLESLLAFARTAGATMVAEGVETQAELDTLARLGVDAVQGYLLSRPVADPPATGFPRPARQVGLGPEADLSVLLAEAVRDAHDLESLALPLLDVVLQLTGLETTYVTVLDDEGRPHRHVRNAAGIDLPPGFGTTWSQALCHTMHSKDLLWTGSAQTDLVECEGAAEIGLQTFVSIPVRDRRGTTVGSLCGGSRGRVFLRESTLGQLRLIAHILGGRAAG
jgi:EAL domain-containing protein (putative c-di-GMP-specific phosphodiesterase class I)